MTRALIAALFAASLISIGAAQAQTLQRAPTNNVGRAPQNVLVARTVDLQPIPSRIEHGVVSIRNTGTTTSAPSIATVSSARPGRGLRPRPAR